MDHFSRNDSGLFGLISDTLLRLGDYHMHLADLTAYAQARAALGSLWHDAEEWTRKAIINVSCSGKFSSDRTAAQYTRDVWKIKPVPVK